MTPTASGLGLGRGPRRVAGQSRLVIIVDTFAWIEFLRDTGSRVCNTVDELLGAVLAICDAISMEVLAALATNDTLLSSAAFGASDVRFDHPRRL